VRHFEFVGMVSLMVKVVLQVALLLAASVAVTLLRTLGICA
jgi:hypothetical protein